MKVTFVCMADWAGSCFHAVRALQEEGLDARQVILGTEGIRDFRKDVYINCGIDSKRRASTGHIKYKKVKKLIEQADILHVWNDTPFDNDFKISSFPLPYNEKPVVNTYTGTFYRRSHNPINLNIKEKMTGKYVVTVQNPNLLFPKEIDSVFVPHAIEACKSDDVYKKTERSPGKMRLGMYVGNHVGNSYTFIRKLVDNHFKDELEFVRLSEKPWKIHLQNVGNCDLFVQDIDESIGYWGRSALEACIIGVPCIAFLSLKGTEGLKQIGMEYKEIPLSLCNKENFKEKITLLIQDKEMRNNIIKQQLDWVCKYYDYKVVARKYIEIYEELLK